jgi:hypothetical protein
MPVRFVYFSRASSIRSIPLPVPRSMTDGLVRFCRIHLMIRNWQSSSNLEIEIENLISVQNFWPLLAFACFTRFVQDHHCSCSSQFPSSMPSPSSLLSLIQNLPILQYPYFLKATESRLCHLREHFPTFHIFRWLGDRCAAFLAEFDSSKFRSRSSFCDLLFTRNSNLYNEQDMSGRS